MRQVLTGQMATIAAMAMLLLASLLPAPARADDFSAEAADYIQELGDDILAMLAERKGDPALKADLGKRLDDNFALDTISRFALGRYWRVATPEQQTEYQNLFRRLVTKVYVNRFEAYSGQTFKLKGTRMGTDRDALVSTEVRQPDGPPVDVDWRIRQINGKMQIVDYMVGGVSMAVTQRSEFASVIQRNGGSVKALIDSLRGQLGNDAQGTAERTPHPDDRAP